MPRSRSSTPWALLGCSTLGLFSLFLLGIGFISSLMGVSESAGGERVALIEVSGAISDEGSSSLIGGSSSGARDIIESLDKARLDNNVKAVVVRINSPGGSPAASQEMFDAVQRLKAAKKPVVCSMGDVAASGGYYVAAACDKIYANAATTTGSIGVISQIPNYSGLLKRLGAGQETFKSGKYKAVGAEGRPLTPDERGLIQSQIRVIYAQFVDAVATGRKGKLTRAQILKLADGRTYTGTQAKANKLIDEVGGLHEAAAEAAKRAGLSEEPKLYRIGARSGLLGSLMSSSGNAAERLAREAATSAAAAAGKSFAETAAAQLRSESSADATPQLR
jgi:protease-4